MKYEIDLPDLPDGFEYTGEYREAESGDNYRTWHGSVGTWSVEAEKSEIYYFILRKAAPATRIDRIKAEYADYYVVELDWNDQNVLCVDVYGLDLEIHTTAQSVKGFYMYVYERTDESFWTVPEPTYYANTTTHHPVAVLFTKDKS